MYACLSVSSRITHERVEQLSPHFQRSSGHPGNSFRDKKLGVVAKGPEYLHCTGQQSVGNVGLESNSLQPWAA